MIKMGKESELTPSEIIEKAVAYFGPPGLGMNVVDQESCCARFQGGGGHVFVQAAQIEDEGNSQVTIEGREWEYHIKQFMGEI
jgi:hypothetical protein